ncbi:MAG: serine/threonine protein kinase [Pirellulales bacterium]|nr:serine/threonine protein kinase [Pirellulales bacterium]
MSPSTPDRAPPELPDFNLLRRVGRGGFGEVWLARNRATGGLRAVKLIPLDQPGHADPAGRELASLARLERDVPRAGEHLVEIQHVGRTDDYLYYVMEPADDASGQAASDSPDYRPATLRNLLDSGPLPPDVCLRWTRQLLEGLAGLHAAGMAHRDVKPSNCLLVDGRLKLADFGLLTRAEPLVSRLGTQAYMPPDGRMDARADVFAAGLVIYELITGQPAERFPHLGPVAASLSGDRTWAALNRVALHAAQPAPADRYPDAGAMLADLARLASPAPRPRRRRRWIGAGVSLFLAAAVVWGAIVFWSRQRVPVNFVTEPFEATIWLDDRRLDQPDGEPYTTPCTVPDVPATEAEVVFRVPGLPDLEAGTFDFRAIREVEARWSQR